MWARNRGESHSGVKDRTQCLALKDWIWIKMSLAERLKWFLKYPVLALKTIYFIMLLKPFELQQCEVYQAEINVKGLNYNVVDLR